MGSPRRIVDAATDGRAQLRRGLAESHRGEAKALLTLAAAKERCLAANDTAGAALCAAASMVTGQALSHFRRLREHIDALAGLRDGSLHFHGHAEALLAYAGMLAGLAFFHPADPFNDRCVERIMSLLELDVDVNLKFAAGRLVLYYTEPREQRELGQRVYSLLQPLMDRADLTPHRLGRWLIVWIVMTAMAKERVQHELANAQARDLVERHADPEVAMWMGANEIAASLPRRQAIAGC